MPGPLKWKPPPEDDGPDAGTVEARKLRAWQAGQLEQLGFGLLEQVALMDAGVGWRDAKALLERGCSHAQAVRILV